MIDYNHFFTARTGTALTATAASANQLDFAVARDMGPGKRLVIEVWTGDADFESGGSSTLDIALQVAPDSSGSPGSYSTIAAAPQVLKAAMVANTKIAVIAVPQDIPNGIDGQYMQLYFTVGTANFTTGKLIAYLTGMEDAPSAYPSNMGASL